MRVLKERENRLKDYSKKTVEIFHCIPNESPTEAWVRAAKCYSGGNDSLAQRIYDYASKGWFGFSTPMIRNAGNNKKLPISCFINMPEDSVQGLIDHFSENMFFSTCSGGIGTSWDNIRSSGEVTSSHIETPGTVSFMGVSEEITRAFKQGQRSGAAAVYLDVSHPEILDFIHMVDHNAGDRSKKSQRLFTAVCIGDDFMKALDKGEDWDLLDPHSKRVVSTVKARDIWVEILKMRKLKKGFPYLFFKDTANRILDPHIKNQGYKIHSSNLCTEILEPTSPELTAVCVLSSLNLSEFESWENTDIVEDLLTMLDNVTEICLENKNSHFRRARKYMKLFRSVGIGAMGYHDLLQKNNIVWGSEEEKQLNKKIFKHISEKALEANLKLGKDRGECPVMLGTGKRMAHTMAIAPTATNSLSLGTSPTIEPWPRNAYTHKSGKQRYFVRNPELVKLLKSKNKDSKEIWNEIALDNGSVQNLDFLTQKEKEVFKTAYEIDQDHIINSAADRQPFLDQTQSVNLFITEEYPNKKLSELHKSAWKKGLPTLYYLRSEASTIASLKISPNTQRLQACNISHWECQSCEG